MADLRKHSSTSNIVRFVLKHSTTGQGLTGLSNASSGLIISTICDNEATATTYTVAGSTVETITTLGTFAAPTATKCRFKEVDATNHKGLYEFQFADARFSVASAKRLVVSVTGATNLLDSDYEIQLVQFDPYDSVRMGITSLPNAAAEAAGGLYTRGTGAGQIAQDANGNIRVNLDTIKTQTVTCASGVTVLASVGTAATSTAQTGDSYTRLGAPVGASISADIAGVPTKTWQDTLVTYTNGQAGKRLRGISTVPFTDGTVNDASATTTAFNTTVTGYGNDFFKDAIIVVELSADHWQAMPITSYVSSTGRFTVSEALYSAPANGVNVSVVSTHIHPISQIQSGLATAASLSTVSSNVAAVKAKTDSLTFTVSGQVDSNVQSINDETILGNGSTIPFYV